MISGLGGKVGMRRVELGLRVGLSLRQVSFRLRTFATQSKIMQVVKVRL